jgi:hypothetical protein
MGSPFYFYTRLHLVRLLGLKARNPRELLECIRKVPASSIYYHTHRFLQQHHYLSPEPPNDFAYWLDALNMKELSEALASVDTVSFKDIEEMRAEFIRIFTEYISKGNRIAEYAERQEFHFMSCVTFVLPTPYVAHDLKEFVEVMRKISIDSIYFHTFEARMRLERKENDFAAWFEDIGKPELAEELSRLDPYTMTLEGLREKIIEVANRYA